MSPDAWHRVSETLDRLLDRPPAERGPFLAALRRSDPDLCRDVESLLDASDPSDRFHTPPSVLLGGRPAPAADDPVFDGGKAGRYEILGEIARGGMGAVYRGRDPAFDRALAVKVLLPRARTNPDAERWFAREARLTGRLQHPGIPPVHEIGRLADGTPFFAMKMVEGRTLAALIAAGGDDWAARRVGVFEQVCRALAYAHSQRVVHRDLKPQNVMVGAFGEVQVMDWGLAKPLDPDGSDGPAEGVAGTPAYMAPEQARGEADAVDERCDVFGLGALLCAMVTGRPPYTAASAQDVFDLAVAGDTAPALAAFAAAGADGDLLAIATRCLQPDPGRRYRNAEEVADAVTRYRESLGEKLRRAELDREAAVVRAAEERRRRRVLAGLAASLVSLVAGGLGVWVWAERVAGQRRARAQSLGDQVTRALDDAEAERAALLADLADPARVTAFLNDLTPWERRLRAFEARVERAAGLAASGRDVLASALVDRLAARQADLESDRADFAFAQQADALHAEILDQQIREQDARYHVMDELYRRRGWSLFGDPDLRAKLAASPIRSIVQASLDDLAALRMSNNAKASDEKFRRLLDLGYELETDDWRRRVRDPNAIFDPAHVDRLTRTVDPRTQTPQAVRFLAGLRRYHKLDPVPLLKTAMLLYPSDFWLLFDYAEITHRTDPAESLAAKRAALALRPQSVAVMNNLGNSYAYLQDFATAGDWFRRCLAIAPGSFAAAHNLAYNECERDTNPRTIAALRQICNDCRVHEHFTHLGIKYGQVEDLDAAAECFRRATALDPQHPRPRQLHESLTRTLEAQTVLRSQEAADPLPWRDVETGLAGSLGDESPADHFTGRPGRKRAGYRVRLEPGVVYALRVRADFEAVLRLESDAFAVLADNNDSRVERPRFTFTVPAAGVYRLAVVGRRATAGGRFRLTGDPPRPAPAPATHHGTLSRTDDSSYTRFRDHHPVALAAGETVVAVMKAATYDARLVLFDGDGNRILQSTRIHPFDGRWTRIEFTAPKPGRYTVTATSEATDRIGGYTLTVFTVPAGRHSPN